MRYVMVVNIGPVQGFIAAARRTRDLWYGSWLLSELSKCAAKIMHKSILQKGGMLIFPAVDETTAGDLEPGSNLNVVNRVVALVEEEPDAIGAEVRAALERLLCQQWEEVFDHEIKGPLYTEEDALAQVLDLVECTWAASPCVTDKDYPAARNAAEELMAARKNTRNFKQVTWGDMRPKSSLDGQREAVIPEDRYPADADDDGTKQLKADALYRQYHAGRAERLSAVDLLKRLGNMRKPDQSGKSSSTAKTDGTPSTSHIAARPFVERLRKEAKSMEPKFEKLIAELAVYGFHPDRPYRDDDGLLGYDGYLLYENRLADEAEDQGRSKEQINKCKDALKAFYGDIAAGPTIDGPHRLQLSPYYALLLGDGDNMGKVVDALKKPEIHCDISRKLSTFAGEAKRIVAAHKGHPIYAGGDDVMAFVPLHTLLDCTNELHTAFGAAVGEFKSEPDETGVTVSPSLSVGIVIAHHLEPLNDVLALARSAEKTAKKHKGKNALAIILSKRSGSDRTIVGGWSEGIADRLRFLMENVATNVPEGAAYEILHMHRKLTPTHLKKSKNENETAAQKEARAHLEKTLALLCDVMALEAVRILERKRGDRGAREIDPKTMDALRSYLDTVGVAEVANELILASLLAKAQQLASGYDTGTVRAERKEKVAA